MRSECPLCAKSGHGPRIRTMCTLPLAQPAMTMVRVTLLLGQYN